MAMKSRIGVGEDGKRKLFLELDINDPLPIAQSGKSYIIASSNSGEQEHLEVNNKKVWFSPFYATIRK